MTDKPAGWYYIGEGRLRYRDDYGWTEFYMDTKDPRAQKWPPPTPKTMLQQVRDAEAERATRGSSHRRGLAGLFGGRRRRH